VKRYAVDTSTLAESKDGAVMLVDYLPVEALESFRPTVSQQDEFGNLKVDAITVLFTVKEYNALRDLLLAIRPGVRS